MKSLPSLAEKLSQQGDCRSLTGAQGPRMHRIAREQSMLGGHARLARDAKPDVMAQCLVDYARDGLPLATTRIQEDSRNA